MQPDDKPRGELVIRTIAMPRDTNPSRFLYEIMGHAEKAPGRTKLPAPHRKPEASPVRRN